MSDYISREAAKSKKVYSNERHEYVVPVADLDWLSTADVKQVVRGKWETCDWIEYDGHDECIHYPDEGLRCSNCRCCFKAELLWADNFCPNCGADMRGNER